MVAANRPMGAVRPSVWAALVLCMGVGPLFLYSVSSVSAAVIEDLGLSSAQFGSIATTTFLSAAVCSAIFGGWADRMSSARLLVLISAGSGLGLLVAGLAPTYAWILIAAVVCGVAQAMSNPATNRYISSMDSPVGPLIGWKQSGVQMSQLLAGLTVPALTVAFGWRPAIAGGAVLAALGIVFGARLRLEASPRISGGGASFRRLGRGVWILTLYTYFIGLGLAAVNTYLPLYAFGELHYSLGVAGLTAAVVGLVGLVSRVLWGRHADADTGLARALVLLGTGSLLGAAVVASAQWGPAGLVWLGAGIFGGSALAANSVTMVALLSLTAPALVGVASGVLATGLYLGFASGPILFGLVLDSFSYRLAWGVPCLAFAVATVAVASSARHLRPSSDLESSTASPQSNRKAQRC